MQVFRAIPSAADAPVVLTIGNFDGVHLGHQALLAQLVSRAREDRLPAAVMTFEPHPREFFSHERRPTRLTSLREKLELFAEAGVDRVYVCRFNARFAALSAEAFIEDLLVRGLGVRHLIIGDDFRFGRGREGDFERLRVAGELHGFSLAAMATIAVNGERVSSSAVRGALEHGDLARAEALLGRPYEISGRVEHGQKIGRELGFPTANVQIRQRSLPLSGIFAVTVTGAGLLGAQGAASVGVRPTIADGLRPTCEVHLLDRTVDLYDRRVSVRFRHKMRDEVRYEGLDALREAIAKDVVDIRHWFAVHTL
ncbi:bifunctional riboflavin kinase/FAD synthetase [Methyloversatilis sp.]|uniref:bifunctional riboflavin kinase/FAD synthetase n=1 Tax=Methyloversatilis sp. TaxID=2569862 RepID=UPI0027358EDF|nr:bifunctional riboflavin kinase/FAD synthetase [Methyloversatilis sp.]MDP2867787.1 bifunctional riboflavin kinase/FAD synthetase [Methyloversatilis sp.]MDP3455980.1 bifunctional riboflavin kinase/FAD synthetase [Methyloversatilis sp.]MDP3579806.1 bifunctional riboflavin kinase/FAD synthetase [Methyloversatilis sp.]